MGDNLSKLQNLSPDLSELTTERKEDYNCVPLPINLMICNHHQTFSGKSLKSFTMGTRYHEYLQLQSMINLFQILKKKQIISINFSLLNVDPLIMTLKFLTQLFLTQTPSFLPSLVKTMISLKLSEVLTLARLIVLISSSQSSSCVMIPFLNFYQ